MIYFSLFLLSAYSPVIKSADEKFCLQQLEEQGYQCIIKNDTQDLETNGPEITLLQQDIEYNQLLENYNGGLSTERFNVVTKSFVMLFKEVGQSGIAISLKSTPSSTAKGFYYKPSLDIKSLVFDIINQTATYQVKGALNTYGYIPETYPVQYWGDTFDFLLSQGVTGNEIGLWFSGIMEAAGTTSKDVIVFNETSGDCVGEFNLKKGEWNYKGVKCKLKF